MLVHIRRAVVLAVVVLVLTFAYAFIGTGVAQVLFKHQADGSITANGSTLIGQNWSITKCPGHPLGQLRVPGSPRRPRALRQHHVQPQPAPRGRPPLQQRPDPKHQVACSFPTASSKPINDIPGESSGTSLGPRSKKLLMYTQCLVGYWKARGVNPTPDLVTTSGSGYDPDISQQDALVQIPMVSKATGLSPSMLRSLVISQTQGAQLGFLGTSYINVLQLNEALAKLEK